MDTPLQEYWDLAWGAREHMMFYLVRAAMKPSQCVKDGAFLKSVVYDMVLLS